MICNDLRATGTVAIVGVGPAGLTLARLLERRGYRVSVHERDASPTSWSQGGSLDLRPSLGQRAIDAAGLTDAFARASRSDATAFTLLDKTGAVLPGAGAETHEDAGPEIDRGDLRALLLASLAPGTVSWGRTVTDVTPHASGGWQVEMIDQAPIVANLVVGADGMGSKVRQRLTSVTPRYTGQTMLAAVIHRDRWHDSDLAALVGQGSLMFAGDNRTIFVQRCARDLILVYYSLTLAEDWPAGEAFGLDDRAEVLSQVRATYADWSPAVVDMLTDVDGDLHRWPLWVMPPEHAWRTQPGLTMIGDASHAMPPFTGKGVNLAMYDALQLADALVADPQASVSTALERFERDMQDRTRRETGACLAVGRNFYGIDLSFDEPLAA